MPYSMTVTDASRMPAADRGASAPFSTERIDRFLTAERPPTPCIVLDLVIVRAQYLALQRLFPAVRHCRPSGCVWAFTGHGDGEDAVVPGRVAANTTPDISRSS